ncbi:MAG: MBL fold metallo-hydrolase, partial [Thermus sp.]
AGRRFAFAETLAHLEYLRLEGHVRREGPPYRYFRA